MSQFSYFQYLLFMLFPIFSLTAFCVSIIFCLSSFSDDKVEGRALLLGWNCCVLFRALRLNIYVIWYIWGFQAHSWTKSNVFLAALNPLAIVMECRKLCSSFWSSEAKPKSKSIITSWDLHDVYIQSSKTGVSSLFSGWNLKGQRSAISFIFPKSS